MDKIKVAMELTIAAMHTKLLEEPIFTRNKEEDMNKKATDELGTHIANLFNSIHSKLEIKD